MVGVGKGVKLRRSPVVLVLGVVFLVAGVLGGIWVVQGLGETKSVLSFRDSLPAGHVVVTQDLQVVEVPRDSQLPVISGEDADLVVGQVLAVPVISGALVSGDYLGVPDFGGQVLVPVYLKHEVAPLLSITPGMGVEVVVSNVSGDVLAVPGKVWDVAGFTSDIGGSGLKVDVLVAPDDAPGVAGGNVSGNVVLVVKGVEVQ